MVIYTLSTCWRCGAGYASFWRDWAGLVTFFRVNDLENAVAEIRPQEPMVCALCAGNLEVTRPYAVRTTDGDWLALDVRPAEHALAN